MKNSKQTVKSSTPHPNPSQIDTAPSAYAQLADFNEICVSAAERLEEFEAASMLSEAESAYYTAMLWELRAAVSQSVADHMSSLELETHARAEKRRIKLEHRANQPA